MVEFDGICHAFVWILESGGPFLFVSLYWNLALVAVMMFSYQFAL